MKPEIARTPEIVVLPDPAALAQEAADRFVALARLASAAQGRFAVALSGGSTPRLLYEQLVTRPIAWEQVHVFWGDERCVPLDHPASNYGMAQRALLSHVPLPTQNVHRLKGELDPAQAAQQSEAELRMFFGTRPCFDLILLGLGSDAHTASLFPQTPALHEQQRWVVAQYVDKLQADRLTLTPLVLNQAANVIFLITGSDKAPALRAVWHGPHDPDHFPAQIVMPTAGRVIWLVDQAAMA
ncbi:MAG TPA: 6-phosphogluconolactonase [Anaerolineae bacterium]|nr:6-phosphogluconolactonase [Anaerolineae bacterium]